MTQLMQSYFSIHYIMVTVANKGEIYMWWQAFPHNLHLSHVFVWVNHLHEKKASIDLQESEDLQQIYRYYR